MPKIEAVRPVSSPGATWRAAGIDARAFHAVLLHLTRGSASERPLVAARVWSALILHADTSGAVRARRADIARTAMCEPIDASRALTDLAKLGAITRHGAGRTSTYRINPDFTSAVPRFRPEEAESGTRAVIVSYSELPEKRRWPAS
jgi:predicted MarR family transcription regulator